MNTGQIISGAGHLAVIGWALFGGAFRTDPPPLEGVEATISRSLLQPIEKQGWNILGFVGFGVLPGTAAATVR